MLEKIQETAAFLKAKMHTHPETAIILGTGLGSLVHEITDKYEINYSEIPNFPVSTVEGHSGKLIFGKLGNKDIMAMPGFVLQRKYDKIATSDLRRKLLSQYTELYGKKYAPERTAQLLARMLSYPIIGVAVALMLGALLISCGNRPGGLAVMLVGALLIVVLTYALYDEVNDKLKKRRAAISRQFPNVVSKLALLVTSGMILDKAWKQTAESQDLVLYREMRKTVNELDNLVEPTAAYTNFLGRCNTKETTKLASALIQSQSKGNAEIGALLKGMAHDAWQERRHTAKRASEAANSKLMIPTIMLFIAILIMIMVPVAMNFTSL